MFCPTCLRRHGVTATITFTLDHGEEFGGQSWLKVQELRKLIAGFGCKLVQNHKGPPEENAHLERSHRTDDEEFYIPRALAISSEQESLHEQLPDLDQNIRFVVPILLDKAAVALGPRR